MDKTTKKYFDRLREMVQATGQYNESDDIVIEHAAYTLMLIGQAQKLVSESGMIQEFPTGAKQISPEVNNLRGLLADFRKYCLELGLSPAARRKLDIQLSEKKQAVSSIMKLRKVK